MGTSVLIVPGLHNSGQNHWQTWLERKHPHYRRVNQRRWDDPSLEEWVDNLEKTIVEISEPVLVVAHSFGCLVAARAGLRPDLPIRGALLVAPASPSRFDVIDAMPYRPLPFPSILVASWNDPWLPFTKACFWANTWGSRLVDLVDAGHINEDSGFGSWPLGEQLLQDLLDRKLSSDETDYAYPFRKSLGYKPDRQRVHSE